MDLSAIPSTAGQVGDLKVTGGRVAGLIFLDGVPYSIECDAVEEFEPVKPDDLLTLDIVVIDPEQARDRLNQRLSQLELVRKAGRPTSQLSLQVEYRLIKLFLTDFPKSLKGADAYEAIADLDDGSTEMGQIFKLMTALAVAWSAIADLLQLVRQSESDLAAATSA